MSLNVFLFLVWQTIDGVIDCEDVLWVEGLLHLLHKVNGGVWEDTLHESLANLSDTVMVG